jgi:hypothetical protein
MPDLVSAKVAVKRITVTIEHRWLKLRLPISCLYKKQNNPVVEKPHKNKVDNR